MPERHTVKPTQAQHARRRTPTRLLVVALAAIALSACLTLPVALDQDAILLEQQAERARQAARPAALCSPQPGTPFVFRKKLLVLAAPVARPAEALDLPGLSASWSRNLQQRLLQTDRFLLRDGSAFRVDPDGDMRQQIVALAEQFDAQFVVSGRIAGLGIERRRIGLGSLGSIPKPFGDARVIETELSVFDGHTGTQLRQVTYASEVEGDVDKPGQRPLQGDFLRTPLGQAMTTMLDRQSEDIEDELACLPMQARVVRTRLHEVHIDAGFTSNLHPGDRLRVLQRRAGTGNGDTGWAEQSFGDLVVKEVFPESAIGYLDGGAQPNWQFNGFVRAW